VLPPSDPSCTCRVRIFTPRQELPFAGHATVGTAAVLASLSDDKQFVFEEGIGPVRVDVDGESMRLYLDSPRYESSSEAPPTAEIARTRCLQVIAVGAVIMVTGLALLRAGAAPGCGRGLAGARPARQRPRDGHGPRPAGAGRHRSGPGHAATRPPGGGMPHAFRRRAQFAGPAVYALPTARTIRPPDRAAVAGNDPGRLTMKSSASAGRVAFAVLDRRRRER
jgi:hypothetical protein